MIHVFRYLLIVLYTIIWGIPATILALLGFGDAVMWIGRQWVRWILWSCGIRVQASGLENVDLRGPCIYMSNHQSVVDIAALLVTLPEHVRLRFVAKKELTRIPLFGWALALSGHVIVDRGNREKAVASLNRAVSRIQAGTNVIFYPEGTRSRTGALGPFKSGGFYLAVAAGVPVVPVAVSGSQHITPKGSLKVHPGVVRIHYGKPILTEGFTIDDREKLKQLVRDGINAGFDPQLQA